MGFFKKFKKFLKGEPTEKQNYNSSYSPKYPLKYPSTQHPPYSQSQYPSERPSINPTPLRRSLESQTYTNKYPSHAKPAQNSLYNEIYTYPEEKPKSLYWEKEHNEKSAENILAAKLETITSQNQTIIEILREINMNLSYKLRR